jgi:hypothetical protein
MKIAKVGFSEDRNSDNEQWQISQKTHNGKDSSHHQAKRVSTPGHPHNIQL